MEKLNSQEIWWQKYRRVKNRPRDQPSLEIIVRKSFTEIVKEYVLHTSLGFIKHICEQNVPKKHRFLWFILLGCMFGVVLYFLQFLWFDTLTKPLIVTMDSSTYPISKIDFPAVAICNSNRVSRKASKILAREIKKLTSSCNESIADIEWFIRQSGRLLDYGYNETISSHRLLNVISRTRANTQVVAERMKQLAPNCSEMLVRCSWNGERADCDSLFKVRRTMHGHCCAFNYVLEYNAAGKADRSAGKAMRQSRPGPSNGLNLVLDPLLDDYVYPLNNIRGFEVLLFDPTHFADPSGGRVIQRIAQPNEVVFFELKSIKQIAAEEVKKYPITIRKCYFHDERPERFGQMYSYSACIVECRIKTILSLCKCTPYFMPTSAKEPMCTLDDLQCLNKYKEKLLYLYPMDADTSVGLELELQDSLYCPECLPDCEFTRHTTKASRIPIELPNHYQGKGFSRSFIRDLNMTDRCIVSIYQSSADGILDRLDVVAYWFEILSNIGGFAGMMVGFSIMCVIEIIYYMVVRFIQVICTNIQRNY